MTTDELRAEIQRRLDSREFRHNIRPDDLAKMGHRTMEYLIADIREIMGETDRVEFSESLPFPSGPSFRMGRI